MKCPTPGRCQLSATSLTFLLLFMLPGDDLLALAPLSQTQAMISPTAPEVRAAYRTELPHRQRRGRVYRLVRAPYHGLKATGKFIGRGARRLVKRRRPRRRY